MRAPITIVKNKNLSVEDCFPIMDHIVEKDKFSDGVNENFYEVLSKSGLTATMTQQQTSLYLRLSSYNWPIRWVYWMKTVVTC